MNTRVLELIKNPRIINESDLSLLESESEKMPYAQSIRALYLYGINLYKTENYKENLSKTAAYTTDKKILYQFINSQKINQNEAIPVDSEESEVVEKKVINEKVTAADIIEKADANHQEVAEAAVVLNKFDIDKIIESESVDNSEFIVVEGEKNRLLYEGEENFLQEKSHEIDLEATKESGVITVKDDLEIKEKLIVLDDNRSEETISEHRNVEEVLSVPEEKAAEKLPDTQVQDEDSSGNVSFNGIEEFLPQVKFSVPKNHLDYLNPPKRELKKETIVTPIKSEPQPEYKQPEATEIPEEKIDKSQISFGETQSFEVRDSKESQSSESQPNNTLEEKTTSDEVNFEKPETFEIKENNISESPADSVSDNEDKAVEQVIQPVTEWKPMSFSANTPDALIGKKAETEIPKSEVEEKSETEEVLPEASAEEKAPEDIPEIPAGERPVMKVSFFGNDVSKIEEKEKEIPAILDKVIEQDLADSNVGTFINTWQSWLKIERPKEDDSAEKTIVVKEKIIDQFIEKNPRISQLKDEVNFVVKEKKDDISHLMTETLAKLYVEQKLYSKAIKAYDTLIEKHPQKKAYFEEKIEEVKEIRKS